MKFLLLLALLAVIWWIWRKKRPQAPAANLAKSQSTERMVACHHCQVHLPESESIRVDARHYCSQVHQQAGEARRGS